MTETYVNKEGNNVAKTRELLGMAQNLIPIMTDKQQDKILICFREIINEMLSGCE